MANMTNQYGVNLAAIDQNVQANKLNKQKIESNAMAMQDRKKARGLTEKLGKIEVPEQRIQILNQLATIQPDAAVGMYKFFSAMDDAERQAVARTNENLLKAVWGIEQQVESGVDPQKAKAKVMETLTDFEKNALEQKLPDPSSKGQFQSARASFLEPQQVLELTIEDQKRAIQDKYSGKAHGRKLEEIEARKTAEIEAKQTPSGTKTMRDEVYEGYTSMAPARKEIKEKYDSLYETHKAKMRGDRITQNDFEVGLQEIMERDGHRNITKATDTWTRETILGEAPPQESQQQNAADAGWKEMQTQGGGNPYKMKFKQ